MTGLDVIVVGAGPAGVAAALTAHRTGLATLLIDEQEQAGGQVHRAPAPGLAPAKRTAGDALRAELAAARVPTLFGRRVWLAERGFEVHVLGAEGSDHLSARALILATGAQERVSPVEGWTLPGVIGLAAATSLLKSQMVLPGRRVVVAGRGPLLLLVAELILAGGGQVAAVIDENGPGAWLAKMPALLSRPDLMAQGAGWLARILGHGVPIHFRSAVRRVNGDDRLESVEVGPVEADRPGRAIACDALCYGHGLAPATELTRAFGVPHVFAPERGGWVVEVDADGRTGAELLFACGDGAGVLGVAAAPLRGELAALTAAHDLGRLDAAAFERAAAPVRRRLARAARFGAAMTALGPPGPHQARGATAATLVCRCEGVTRAAIDAAVEAGAATLNAVKSVTRCGMGPCGARFCGEAAAEIVAARLGVATPDLGQMTGRPPVRPLPIAAIVGEFRYADLHLPEPAPV